MGGQSFGVVKTGHFLFYLGDNCTLKTSTILEIFFEAVVIFKSKEWNFLETKSGQLKPKREQWVDNRVM